MAEPHRSGSPRSLRADAARNRARIVDAAWQVFTAQGPDAPMEDVARVAGVGVATVYRRFGSRAELVACAFERTVAAYGELVDDALADPDPWSGFRHFIEQICATQADDRGFAHVLSMTFPRQGRIEAERARAYDGMVELITRAKSAGRLRDDFAPEDIGMLLMANAGVVAATRDAAPDTWRRFVAYMLQAFTAEGDAAPALPPPPTSREMYRALVRAQRNADHLRGGGPGHRIPGRRPRQTAWPAQGAAPADGSGAGAQSGHGRGSGSGSQRPSTTL
ncbi:TetR family transcriptional regulator [Haloactinopolyspora alba]|uniref:TetR family transcriptional regulator n=1 Tax=Haloactinopolyspora alba TaxID=648780 RepID=A0A2P8E7J1_9ACTN|nr:TetR/AcrR family transcriptional regulator [Haloactinopolyspora alba]PSL05443.1 TetR family transcriptional regulator [Haloactinopolyspora alba]